MKRERNMVSQMQALEWLAASHPELHAVAETERDWVWIAAPSLAGDHNKAVRESLKAFGFRWAKGGHVLPSGRMGTWGHACLHPTRFKHKAGGKVGGNGNNTTGAGAQDNDDVLAIINAALAGV